MLTAAALLWLAMCQTEDSANCIWLAPIQGNGRGASFIDVRGQLYRLN